MTESEPMALDDLDGCPIMNHFMRIGNRGVPKGFRIRRETKVVLSCPFRGRCMIKDAFPEGHCGMEIWARRLEGKGLCGRETVILVGLEK